MPKNFIVGVRLSPENSSIQQGLDVDETIQIVKWLIQDKVDYIHLSMADAAKYPEKYSPEHPDGKKTLVTLLKDKMNSSVPLIVAGGITTVIQAENIINLGADAVGLGKIAIGNPEFPNKSLDINYKPKLQPYDHEYLKECMVNDKFYIILKNFPGLLK